MKQVEDYKSRASFEEGGASNQQCTPATSRDYFVLLKPRVMSLVVFTAFVGLFVAPAPMNPILAVIAILCIAAGAGASGALNMWYDADIDALMKRTKTRPIPAGKISAKQALVFGLVLSVFSVFIMGLFINWFSAFFLAFTIFFYVVIYTIWLKRSTPQNIVIGGAAGAFPPMIGWAAVTGSVSFESVGLFLIIFLWTPPHFWALSLFSTNDYSAAGIPMMPNIYGERVTKNQIFIYAILTAFAGFIPMILHLASYGYGLCAGVLGAIFIYRSYFVWRASDSEITFTMARRLFFFSLIYLAAIFSILLVDVALIRFIEG
ncbi:heme o synthase [Bartonella sp. DGB2]|uniref:heme o synthase n=1 Tax=Bartonella sp. DGB2 TaxID=3388426 RepID=UPI0039902F40